MQTIHSEGTWSLELNSKEEALALLEAQASSVGNRELSSTEPSYDRLDPGRRAIELLHFAELVLPSAEAEASTESVTFPEPEAQHLSGLMYGALRLAVDTGTPTTAHDGLLAAMNAQVDEFFGMDE